MDNENSSNIGLKNIVDLSIDVPSHINRIIQPYHHPWHSASSFDYCFNYFRSFADQGNQKDIAAPANKHISCLQLGWFLANWGMLRGSSFLRIYSITHFEPLIQYIADCDERLWHIDVDSYTDENVRLVVQSKKDIQRILGLEKEHNVTDTLATKVMMAVFGNVPAFDRFFRIGLGLNSCSEKNLLTLREFYDMHRLSFESANIHTFDVATGKPTTRLYPKARLMDIVGFVQGGGAGSGADGLAEG
jgi:hypothetical protein